MALTTYNPSGFFRPLTLVRAVAAAATAAVLAWPYQALVRWIPFIYLNAILCGMFAALVAALGMWAIKTGHCRNRAIALLIALPIAATAVGATYFWDLRHAVTAVAEGTGVPRDEIERELTFERYLQLKLEAGFTISNHGSGGTKLDGWGVWTVWGIEALIIFGVVVFLMWGEASAPYCERCNRWAVPKKLVIPGLGREQAAPLVERGDLTGLVDLRAPPEPDPLLSLTYTATLCPNCKETGYITVEEKRITVSKRGKRDEKTQRLVKHAALSASDRERLLTRMEPPAPAAAAAR
jgi:hypothetical protein